MTLRNLLAVILLAFGSLTSALAADTFSIDPVHSSVGFSVQHLVISHVKGNFKDLSGTIVYDSADVSKSSVEVHIQAASFDTGTAQRDADVKSPNFLDVQKYPEIVFKSSRVEKSGEAFVAHGTLTIHGVSKEIDLPFTLSGQIKDPWGNSRIGAEASLTINRHDYGLNYNKTIESGGLIVGDEVKIDLAVEAVKKK